MSDMMQAQKKSFRPSLKPSRQSLISRGLLTKKRPQHKSHVPNHPSTSGYSLYSTDSEDLVPMTTKGLDRCAALLGNILEGETSFCQYKCNENNVIREKSTITKAKSKQDKIECEKSKSKHGRKVKAPDAIKNVSIKQEGSGVTAFHQRLVTSTPTKKNTVTKKQKGDIKGHQRTDIQKDHKNSDKQKLLPKKHQKKKDKSSDVYSQSMKNNTKNTKNEIKEAHQEKAFPRLSPPENITSEEESNLELTPTNRVILIDNQNPAHSRPPATIQSEEKQNKHCANQLRTAKYLLSELNALLQDNCDVETHRLLNEMDVTLNTIPYQVVYTTDLQPLRSENCHLRRKLRITNKKLRDSESRLKDQDNPNFELLSCKALVEVLQNKLKDEQSISDKLKKENEETKKGKCDEIQMKVDDLREEYERLRKQLQQNKLDYQDAMLQLQEKEKELNIKELCLNQKDAEIERMKEINQSLQNTISSLLIELKGEPRRHRFNRLVSTAPETKGTLSSVYTSDWINAQNPSNNGLKLPEGKLSVYETNSIPHSQSESESLSLVHDDEVNVLHNRLSYVHQNDYNEIGLQKQTQFKKQNHIQLEGQIGFAVHDPTEVREADYLQSHVEQLDLGELTTLDNIELKESYLIPPTNGLYSDKCNQKIALPTFIPMNDTYKYMLNTTNGSQPETTLSSVSVTSRDEYIFQEGLHKLDKDIECLQRNLIHMGISLKYNQFPKYLAK